MVHPVPHRPSSGTAVLTFSRELFGYDYWKVSGFHFGALMIMAGGLTPAGFEGRVGRVGGRKGEGAVFVIMGIITLTFVPGTMPVIRMHGCTFPASLILY